jgi:hypothetical protein
LSLLDTQRDLCSADLMPRGPSLWITRILTRFQRRLPH